MKLTWKDLGFELSVEEAKEMLGLFTEGINVTKALSDLGKLSASLDESTEECDDKDKEIDITDVMPKPVEKSDDIVYISVPQLMKEFNLRSSSTVYYHIENGFDGYKRVKSGKSVRMLIDREAFRKYYESHNNETIKGKRGTHTPSIKVKKLESVESKGTDWESWAAEQRNKCRLANLDPGKTFSMVYRRMTNDYGVVFDQLRKEYVRKYGVSPKATIELVYILQNDDKNYTQMFEGILANIIADSEGKKYA